MHIIKSFFIYFIFLLLVGCSTIPKQVYIPIAQKCVIPEIPTKPLYPILSANSTAPDFVKWCLISNKMCKNYNNELLTILNSYK